MIKQEKMVGVWIEESTLEKLDLIAIQFNTNRSKYIRELVTQIVSQQSTEQLIENIVQKSIKEYQKCKMNFKPYMGELRDLLERKKVSESYIKLIEQKMKQWKDNVQNQ
jgi:ATP/ADP translocase